MKTRIMMLVMVIVAAMVCPSAGAPYVPPKMWSYLDPVLSTDFNTMNTRIAASINNIDPATQIPDSSITSAKLAPGSINLSSITGNIGFVTTGAMVQYAGDSQTDTLTNAGWFICDGRAISRTYELYGVIGTTYGVGNGSSTFNLPDLRGRMAIGANPGVITASITEDTRSIRVIGDTGGVETHVLTDTEMPSHSHNLTANNDGGLYASHAGYSNTLATEKQTTESGGDAPHINMPPFIVVNYIIYAGRP
ncbi:MAG TPA: tail fiber protein [bacterium]|nr:tail fiber protein [bacterium]